MHFILGILKNPLINSSIVLFLGSNIANLFNLLFTIFMNRNLSASDFGILLSLVSLITLVTTPATAISPTIVNFAAKYFANDQLDKVKGLFFRFGKLSALLGILIFLFFAAFSNFIGLFLQIDNHKLIFLTGLTIFFAYLGVMNLSFIQAKLSFGFISFLYIIGAIIKLLLGIIFILSGFKVFGALWAYFLSFFFPYILSFAPLGKIFQKHIQSSKTQLVELMKYAFPSTIAFVSLNSFITTDVILVKHFFQPEDAGYYANLSITGRIIFYFTVPIISVMFPLIVQKYARNEKYHNLFFLSLFLVAIASIFLTILYFLFPEFFILLLVKQREYLKNAQYLGYFAFFIAIYSLLNVVVNFFLAIRKTFIFIPITIAALLQVIFIFLFHTTTLEIIMVSIIISCLLLIFFLIYYLHAAKQ